MGQWLPIPLPTQSAEARSTFASKQRLVNLYPEIASEGDKGPFTVYSAPGLKKWLAVGSGPIRGLREMNGDLYVVSKTTLYLVDSARQITTISGTVAGTGAVHMTDNGTHLAIAAVDNLYYADKSGVVEILDPDDSSNFEINGAASQDGYGLFTEKSTIGKLWWTSLDDMTTIGALNNTTADAFSDKAKGMISDHREVWIFKEKSIEIFYNAGGSTTPFVRAQPGFIERGCVSEFSIAKAENTIFWLGDDFAVYMAPGYNHRRISTPWIEERIRAQSDKSTARAFTYSQGGQNYYVLSFAGLTAVYSMSTGRWHERESPTESRWRADGHTFFNEKHLTGDFEGANIYEIDLDTYDDNGLARMCTMVTPIFNAGGRRTVIDELYLDIETGTGRDWSDWDGTQKQGASGLENFLSGENPEIWLDWSDDGGNIWSNERIANMGTIGDRTIRATWTRIGSFRQPGRMFRFRFPDIGKVAVMGAYARVEVWD